MTAIIILNWNGWQDTIECLQSIRETKGSEYSVVVVDNGSTDDSIHKMKDYVSKIGVGTHFLLEGERLNVQLRNRDIVLYQLSKNYGFAKGNNLGLELLEGQNINYYWILNNDTVIQDNSINILENFMNGHTAYWVCTPQIRYFKPNNKIWNCGGKLSFGFRKYYYEDATDVAFQKDYFDISFVTGCALFVRPESLDKNRHIFTERFFFGEEDFDFSLRMKNEKKKMACITKSLIFHKVSSSTKNHVELPKVYIHYLNRYINIKLHFRPLKYCVWKMVNNIWIPVLLLRKGYPFEKIKTFMLKLNKDSKERDSVDYDYFMSALQGKII